MGWEPPIGVCRSEMELQRPNLTILDPVFCIRSLSTWIRRKSFFWSTNFHFFGGQKDLFLEAWSDFQEWGCPAKLLEIALGKYEAGLSEILTGDHRCSPISEWWWLIVFQSYELKGNMLAKKEDLVKGAKELNKKGWKMCTVLWWVERLLLAKRSRLAATWLDPVDTHFFHSALFFLFFLFSLLFFRTLFQGVNEYLDYLD